MPGTIDGGLPADEKLVLGGGAGDTRAEALGVVRDVVDSPGEG